MKMKKLKGEPIFKGMKKGYAAIFYTEGETDCDGQYNESSNRFRVFHSRNLKDNEIYSPDSKEPKNIVYSTVACVDLNKNDAYYVAEGCPNVYQPCWVRKKGTSIKRQIQAMLKYDKEGGRTTHFLGYVKDVE